MSRAVAEIEEIGAVREIGQVSRKLSSMVGTVDK